VLSKVVVFAPATVANVGSAFDVLGFAVSQPGDTVECIRNDSGEVRVLEIEGDAGRLPLDSTKNTSAVSVVALFSELRRRHPKKYDSIGFDLRLTKGLPIGSGLGSSSASAVAAVVAANEVLGAPFTRLELLPYAMEGERIACGTAHADNVGPCLLGGFVLIRSYDPLDVVSLPTPSSAWVVVVTPSVEVRTEDARKILRHSIPLVDAISQWGNVAALVAAIYRDDVALMGRALQDKVIEPVRAALIPGFYEAKSAALSTGALGCSISGSGPSLFALAASQNHANTAGAAVVAAFNGLGISATMHTSQINSAGATVLKQE
jgi:homoserine kinase